MIARSSGERGEREPVQLEEVCCCHYNIITCLLSDDEGREMEGGSWRKTTGIRVADSLE